MTRLQATFIALVALQAAHSFEEYVGRLYEASKARPVYIVAERIRR